MHDVHPVSLSDLANHFSIAEAAALGVFLALLIPHPGAGAGIWFGVRLRMLEIIAGLLIVDGFVLIWSLMRHADEFVTGGVTFVVAWIMSTALARRALHVIRIRRKRPFVGKTIDRGEWSVEVVPHDTKRGACDRG